METRQFAVQTHTADTLLAKIFTLESSWMEKTRFSMQICSVDTLSVTVVTAIYEDDTIADRVMKEDSLFNQPSFESDNDMKIAEALSDEQKKI